MEELKRDIVYLALGTNLHQVVYDMMLSFANSSVPNDGDGVDDGNDDDGDNDSTAGYNKYARAQVGHSANAMALGLTEMGSLTKHNVLDFFLNKGKLIAQTM
ncbi:hypothetical protein GGI02_002313 [Coemansia sp. RSA 2322]|nr:hypothetical protein GGI02_002313 [Coemansia sp. RSA 2322]